jgi:2-methylisocitrate lyase-like PEP mutase family enzyme
MARTDARATDGLGEALWRAEAFADLGADVLFVEAPVSRAEMERICAVARVPQMANLVEGGDTPRLPAAELEAIGYRIAAHPLTLLSAGIAGMQDALAELARGAAPRERLAFPALRELVGFDAYDREQARYAEEETP